MYTHSNPAFSRASDFPCPLPSPNAPTAPPPMPALSIPQYRLIPDQLAANEFEWVLNSEANHNNSCSSGCSSYGSPSSLASYMTHRPSLIQRSVSSHSLHKNETHHPVSAHFADFLDSDDGPVRRVYSTGDLQRINVMQHRHSNHQSDSPYSSESSMIIEGMNRACRYSPEEKKVRIERYRSKRNQRNFNKKIKYACRKTLADSRPRIRGRFARNEEPEKNQGLQWRHNNIGGGEEEDEEDENWVNLFDALVAANIDQDPRYTSSSFGLMF